MSKDMRDWPRANLGVAASMFNNQKYGSWGFAIQNRDVATPAAGWPAGLSQLIVSGTCHFLGYIINVWVAEWVKQSKNPEKSRDKLLKRSAEAGCAHHCQIRPGIQGRSGIEWD